MGIWGTPGKGRLNPTCRQSDEKPCKLCVLTFQKNLQACSPKKSNESSPALLKIKKNREAKTA
ncbi:MAG: hypothetical protein CRN43_03940 [Candidatus Nephrothrix sp. EaCA]|nr:MAG: hypothetical protein CRN43_03940 [Candidatus Nephrothrix sp. EaCA]